MQKRKQKKEYKTIYMKGAQGTDCAMLNELAKDEWDLVSVISMSGMAVAYLERDFREGEKEHLEEKKAVEQPAADAPSDAQTGKEEAEKAPTEAPKKDKHGKKR